MKVSRDDDIPNIWKNKECSKPPTSNIAIEIGPVEIVDLPNYKMVDLSIVFCKNQRISPISSSSITMNKPRFRQQQWRVTAPFRLWGTASWCLAETNIKICRKNDSWLIQWIGLVYPLVNYIE